NILPSRGNHLQWMRCAGGEFPAGFGTMFEIQFHPVQEPQSRAARQRPCVRTRGPRERESHLAKRGGRGAISKSSVGSKMDDIRRLVTRRGHSAPRSQPE